MTEIIDFPGETRLDLDPEKVLDAAHGKGFESVTIIGWKEDGEMYLAGSAGDVLQTIASLDIAKAALIRDMVD
jgi:hypothetical protein